MSTDLTVLTEEQEVNIPSWVVDLASFRRWSDQDEFLDTGRIWYIRGKVWLDMSREQLFTHIQVKDQFTQVLGRLVEKNGLGFYFSDGLLLTNVSANISGNPDSTFVSKESLKGGEVRFLEGVQGGYTEVEGSPDMVLEVVSRSSVRKDTKVLHEVYWDAGIQEYWLVDARKPALRFDIFRHTAKGYVSTPKQAGWLNSKVFGKSFKLTQSKDSMGYPKFTLKTR
jgi:Uma2 family endonuclease